MCRSAKAGPSSHGHVWVAVRAAEPAKAPGGCRPAACLLPLGCFISLVGATLVSVLEPGRLLAGWQPWGVEGSCSLGWADSPALLPCPNGSSRDLLLALGPFWAQVGLLMCRIPRVEDQEVTCLVTEWLCGAGAASASTLVCSQVARLTQRRRGLNRERKPSATCWAGTLRASSFTPLRGRDCFSLFTGTYPSDFLRWWRWGPNSGRADF